MKSHVVVYSGGMDSYTLLNFVIARWRLPGERVMAISFDYHQRHSKELEYARKETQRLGIQHTQIELPALVGLKSALSDMRMPVPEGHYAAESMKQTVVPGRNLVMLSCAAAVAESLLLIDEEALGQIGQCNVYYGAHSGDHHIYPDCRPEFIMSTAETLNRSSAGKIALVAPFMYYSKGEIAALGKELGLDYSKSWTCYKGEEVPCGKCGACVERAEAMAFAGIEDPLLVKGS